jgi:hypothetical protein
VFAFDDLNSDALLPHASAPKQAAVTRAIKSFDRIFSSSSKRRVSVSAVASSEEALLPPTDADHQHSALVHVTPHHHVVDNGACAFNIA